MGEEANRMCFHGIMINATSVGKQVMIQANVKPVDDFVGLLCAQDAKAVYSCVGGSQVSMLTRTSTESTCRTLTSGQELAHI